MVSAELLHRNCHITGCSCRSRGTAHFFLLSLWAARHNNTLVTDLNLLQSNLSNLTFLYYSTCVAWLGCLRKRKGVRMANVLKNGKKVGRVVRRYRNMILIEEFPKWQDLIRSKARGCGLYALYRDEQLKYVGLATQSIRSRIHTHMGDRKKPLTHFSVFLVTGSNTAARARRIRDLEALLLNVIRPRPIWNGSKTHFVGAKKLKIRELSTGLAA